MVELAYLLRVYLRIQVKKCERQVCRDHVVDFVVQYLKNGGLCQKSTCLMYLRLRNDLMPLWIYTTAFVLIEYLNYLCCRDEPHDDGGFSLCTCRFMDAKQCPTHRLT